MTTKISIGAALLILFSLTISAQDMPMVFQTDGIAIRGYDPVSYFTSEEPTPGMSDFKTRWNGAIWYFSSKDNLDSFLQNPEKYAPQYGGYCAWGMREGYKADTDPKKAWTLVNGKLYLNYNKSVMKGWLPEKEESIVIANENWSKFTHSPNE